MALHKGYIPLRDAAVRTGYHPDYLSSLIRQGRLSGIKVGKAWTVSTADLNRYSKKSSTSASTVHIVGVALAALFVVVGVVALWNMAMVRDGRDASVATSKVDEVLRADETRAIEIR
jgi:excisionase family DNA binding protein